MSYTIYAKETGTLKGREVIEKQPIACRLCGSIGSWKPERDTTGDDPRSFTCRHPAIHGWFPHFDSIATKDIWNWECVSFGQFEESGPECGTFWALVDPSKRNSQGL